MSNQPIYLDYNATTPVDERVLEAMLPYFTQKFGNAASIQHSFGWDAEEAVSTSRDQIASLLGVKGQNIVFTSSATEAINLAIQGTFDLSGKKNHIITCSTEHKAVLDTCEHLKSKGGEVSLLNVDTDGRISITDILDAIKESTLMVCVMSANNETGVLQDLQEVGNLCQEKGVHFLSDITQSAGKIATNLHDLNADFAALSSHKLYGPKGVGALYVRDMKLIAPQIFGGGHEKGLRSGTLNVPGIVGFGHACEVASDQMDAEGDRLAKLRDYIESELLQLGDLIVNGEKANRLPHVSNISFEDIDGSRLMRSLKGLAVSQGSACNSAVIEPSHVLKAMGLSDRLAYASLRISLGRYSTEEDVRKAVQTIRSVIEQQRMQLL
ncbi:MAG: cysteine desulfurase family protein [Ekhidna sp.]